MGIIPFVCCEYLHPICDPKKNFHTPNWDLNTPAQHIEHNPSRFQIVVSIQHRRAVPSCNIHESVHRFINTPSIRLHPLYLQQDHQILEIHKILKSTEATYSWLERRVRPIPKLSRFKLPRHSSGFPLLRLSAGALKRRQHTCSCELNRRRFLQNDMEQSNIQHTQSWLAA